MSAEYVDANMQRVYHVLEQAELIRKRIDGVSYEQLIENDLLLDALMHNVTVIGEAARAMDADFRAAHAEIPWRSIVGMRNVLVHEYDDVDCSILWEVITHDIPVIVPELEKIYDDFELPDGFVPPAIPGKNR